MFKHKGIDIAVSDAGKFVAYIDGHEVTATSLPAMKKKIDAGNPFAKFDAIDMHHGHGPVHVVGVSHARASWRKDEWRISDGTTRRSVYANSAENKAVLVELAAMRKRHEDVRAVHEKERAALEGRLVELKPPAKEA